jgi:hypothetical protein
MLLCRAGRGGARKERLGCCVRGGYPEIAEYATVTGTEPEKA